MKIALLWILIVAGSCLATRWYRIYKTRKEESAIERATRKVDSL